MFLFSCIPRLCIPPLSPSPSSVSLNTIPHSSPLSLSLILPFPSATHLPVRGNNKTLFSRCNPAWRCSWIASCLGLTTFVGSQLTICARISMRGRREAMYGDRISGQRERERELSQNVFWTWLQEMRVFTKICGEDFLGRLINSILKSKLQYCFRDVSRFSTLFLEFQDRRRLKYSWQKRECVKIFYYPLQIKCSDLKKYAYFKISNLIWRYK